MKVLQLISSGGLYGAEGMVVQLSQALEGLGCSTTVGVFENSHATNTEIAKVASQKGLKVQIFPCNGRWDRSAIERLKESLREQQFDVIHSHGYKADIYGYSAARSCNKKIVATAHNWPGRSLSLRLYATLDRWFLRKFDYVCAVSPEVRETLAKSGVRKERLALVTNGIAIDEFSKGKASLRDEIGWQEHRVIGFVGRLAPEKGLENLLHTVAKIVATNPEVRLMLVGDGPERQKLESLSRQLGIADYVFFFGRRMDLPAVYASFDIFVLPSLTEGTPLALLEAMAAHKPVVATKVGAIPQIVSEGRSGLLVAPGESETLKSAIDLLLSDASLCEQLAGSAYEDMVTHHSAGRMAEEYLEVYQQVVLQKPGFLGSNENS